MRNPDGVHFFRHPIVHVRDKVSVSLLLKVEVIYIDSMRGQIGVELGLLRELSLGNFLAPERMLSQVLPIDTFNGIFFEATR